ncbi:MAG: hypothetical protein JSV04_00730 [Candidatus Heimdallarchaeota archaeon]|nr:MAG: hypothetical protein JSV04_00730 [Candidatus Heimdallarchaeota archaeon]
MKRDLWLERGMDELQQGHWFDGFQMLEGALQRAFRLNKPDQVEKIVSKALSTFSSTKQSKLACDLVHSLILNLRQKRKDLSFVKLIPFVFSELRQASLEKCVRNLCNQIMLEKTFQVSEFLSHLNGLIIKSHFSDDVISDLYFSYAGLLCHKKDFVQCFEIIHAWSQEISSLSLKMRAYLTLAEINAYEIEDCGKYLDSQKSQSDASSFNSQEESYLEIATRIFNAVLSNNNSEFDSTIADHSKLINVKNDGLLKALCDGITEIFDNKSSPGLFSLFKP